MHDNLVICFQEKNIMYLQNIESWIRRSFGLLWFRWSRILGWSKRPVMGQNATTICKALHEVQFRSAMAKDVNLCKRKMVFNLHFLNCNIEHVSLGDLTKWVNNLPFHSQMTESQDPHILYSVHSSNHSFDFCGVLLCYGAFNVVMWPGKRGFVEKSICFVGPAFHILKGV